MKSNRVIIGALRSASPEIGYAGALGPNQRNANLCKNNVCTAIHDEGVSLVAQKIANPASGTVSRLVPK